MNLRNFQQRKKQLRMRLFAVGKSLGDFEVLCSLFTSIYLPIDFCGLFCVYILEVLTKYVSMYLGIFGMIP